MEVGAFFVVVVGEVVVVWGGWGAWVGRGTEAGGEVVVGIALVVGVMTLVGADAFGAAVVSGAAAAAVLTVAAVEATTGLTTGAVVVVAMTTGLMTASAGAAVPSGAGETAPSSEVRWFIRVTPTTRPRPSTPPTTARATRMSGPSALRRRRGGCFLGGASDGTTVDARAWVRGTATTAGACAGGAAGVGVGVNTGAAAYAGEGGGGGGRIDAVDVVGCGERRSSSQPGSAAEIRAAAGTAGGAHVVCGGTA